ncbi:hypothetical protein C2E23DRAFT_27949 [Lenzites betulinus]|nr:hypothetical protein C2E23DRAFT_27949 [Lenzites betulinus]
MHTWAFENCSILVLLSRLHALIVESDKSEPLVVCGIRGAAILYMILRSWLIRFRVGSGAAMHTVRHRCHSLYAVSTELVRVRHVDDVEFGRSVSLDLSTYWCRRGSTTRRRLKEMQIRRRPAFVGGAVEMDLYNKWVMSTRRGRRRFPSVSQ